MIKYLKKVIYMKKLAKRKDDGTYALLGMMHQCASYFDMNITSECVSHIVHTYLQSINYCTFFEWIRSKEVHLYVTEHCETNLNDEWEGI